MDDRLACQDIGSGDACFVDVVDLATIHPAGNMDMT